MRAQSRGVSWEMGLSTSTRSDGGTVGSVSARSTFSAPVASDLRMMSKGETRQDGFARQDLTQTRRFPGVESPRDKVPQLNVPLRDHLSGGKKPDAAWETNEPTGRARGTKWAAT